MRRYLEGSVRDGEVLADIIPVPRSRDARLSNVKNDLPDMLPYIPERRATRPVAGGVAAPVRRPTIPTACWARALTCCSTQQPIWERTIRLQPGVLLAELTPQPWTSLVRPDGQVDGPYVPIPVDAEGDELMGRQSKRCSIERMANVHPDSSHVENDVPRHDTC